MNYWKYLDVACDVKTTVCLQELISRTTFSKELTILLLSLQGSGTYPCVTQTKFSW